METLGDSYMEWARGTLSQSTLSITHTSRSQLVVSLTVSVRPRFAWFQQEVAHAKRAKVMLEQKDIVDYNPQEERRLLRIATKGGMFNKAVQGRERVGDVHLLVRFASCWHNQSYIIISLAILERLSLNC